MDVINGQGVCYLYSNIAVSYLTFIGNIHQKLSIVPRKYS